MTVDPIIPMITATPCEFSDRWTWQAGDRGILLGDGREVLITSTRQQMLVYGTGTLSFIFPYSSDPVQDEAEVSEIIPIPNIKQLQEMSGYIWRTFDEMCAYEYHTLKRIIKSDKPLSKEIVGLAVFMRIKYGKEWDGEAWVSTSTEEDVPDV